MFCICVKLHTSVLISTLCVMTSDKLYSKHALSAVCSLASLVPRPVRKKNSLGMRLQSSKCSISISFPGQLEKKQPGNEATV